MAFPPEFLEEVRSRVALTPVIARKVKLVRAGREMKGCCPFHDEKTPSFYVNEDKGFYHCFGCGAHGDVFRFLVEADGLGFREAVERLAAEAGLELPQENAAAAARARAAAGLTDIMEAAARWFAEQLDGLGGTAARDYVQRRGLTPETVRAFGLGFAPDARARLKAALAVHGNDRLVDVGLLIAPEEGESYDRFRGRLMFPIRDARGRVIAFGGRILGDGQPKYLNSPDTLLFDKGRTLYNLDRAGPAARQAGRIVVVEGYMDVIALAQAGIAEAVAPLGTALTEAQLVRLWRIADEPLLCFDGDPAGQRAALRAALRALPLLQPGKSLRFVTLPPGQDPDDVARAGGRAALEALLAAPEPLIDRLWRAEIEGVELTTPERRAAAKARLRDHARSIAHADVSRLYEEEFRARADALFAPRRGGAAPRAATYGSAPARPAARLRADSSERAVLAALIERPTLADRNAELLAGLRLSTPALQALLAAILDACARHADLDKAALEQHLRSAGLDATVQDVRRLSRLAFSFTRPRTSTDVANRDLACVVEHLMARQRIDGELAAIRGRYAALEASEFEAQQRLVAERGRIEKGLMQLAQADRGD